MANIEVRVGARTLLIALDAERAPGLSAALLQTAPHATLAVHTPIAGAEFCVPVPFFHWHENRRPPAPSDVGYASFGNYLCFYYGPMSAADGPTNVVGRLLSPASELDSLGRELLAGGAQRATVHPARPAGGAASPPPAPMRSPTPPPLPPGAAPLARHARALLDAALAAPPADIAHLRNAQLPAMGNVAGRLQAGVLLLAVSEVLLHARTQATLVPEVLQTTQAGLAAQLARYARWLEMAGMPGTAGWLAAADGLLRAGPVTAGQLIAAVEEALVACGRLRFWVEAFSPWHKVQRDYSDDSAWTSAMLRD